MVAPSAFSDDPLRVLRLVRIAVELDMQPEPGTMRVAREHAAALARCSPERVFVELRRIIAAARALDGLELLGELGATRVVLPELDALRDVEQSRFHHADVYGHTLEVLERTITWPTSPTARGGPDRGRSWRRGERGAARARRRRPSGRERRICGHARGAQRGGRGAARRAARRRA